MNPLQHPFTCELSWSERLHLKDETHALLISTTVTEMYGTAKCVSVYIYIHHLCAKNLSDRLAYLRLVGHVHSPHVGFANESFSIWMLGGDL